MVFKPATKKELRSAINLYCLNKDKGIKKYGIIGNWDVSLITNMNSMFYDRVRFNEPLNNWNTSNVTNMICMFYHCKSFNQPLNNWNTSNVTIMNGMFYECKDFNQPLDNWDVSNVNDADEMFYDCRSYNKSLIMWHSISDDLLYYNKSLINTLDDLIAKPYTFMQKNVIINNIMNTSIINYIWNHQIKIMNVKYKNIFEGYKMSYKVVNYNILYVLEHLGIKMSNAIDYDRFNNELLVDLHINKKNIIVNSLIKHIKETDTERHSCLNKNLSELFNKRLNKKVNVMIYNNGILVADIEE